MVRSTSFSRACSSFPLVRCLPPLSLTHRHTSLVSLGAVSFEVVDILCGPISPWIITALHCRSEQRCQSHFFNRLQLYTESIKLKYLCSASCFVKRPSLPMNIITVMGCIYAFATTLKELNWGWIVRGAFQMLHLWAWLTVKSSPRAVFVITHFARFVKNLGYCQSPSRRACVSELLRVTLAD